MGINIKRLLLLKNVHACLSFVVEEVEYKDSVLIICVCDAVKMFDDDGA